MKVVAVVLSALTLAFVSAVSSAVKIQARNDSMYKEVVGGYADDITNVLSQVAILELTTLLGSGSIIRDNIVLSVAHILYGRDKAHLRVRSGSNFYNRWGLLVHVADTIIHSDYSHCEGCYKYDIALIILLHSAIAPGIHAAAIKLCSAYYVYAAGTVGRVSAWGATAPNGPPSEALITISLPIVSSEDCTVNYGPEVTSDHLCGGNGHTHLCSEDSGAGLIINNKLAGLAALGGHCGLVPAAPSGFTSIPIYRNWISSKVAV